MINRTEQSDEIYECRNIVLAKDYLLKKIKNNQNISSSDLETAAGIQRSLLPSKKELNTYKKKYEVEINYVYQTPQTMGGDYWTLREMDKDSFFIFVADFSYHGAAVLIDILWLHEYIKRLTLPLGDLSQIFTNMNRDFHSKLQDGQYLTCFAGIINYKTQTLSYCGAGMPPIIAINNRKATFLDCTGIPIGAYQNANYNDNLLEFTNDDELLIYSDALVEINNDNKKLFTEKSILSEIEELSKNPCGNILENILKTINIKKHIFSDDLTIISLKPVNKSKHQQ
ncbi:MAG: SpoIIE family protein phosphatase [Rickettsiales bacterium]